MNIKNEYSACSKCTRIHCNGEVHKDALAPFVYPICHICGIELCDLIELLENDGFRDTERCELCSLKYGNQHDPRTHFEAHFYRSNNRCEIRFYCLECSDTSTENNASSSASAFIENSRDQPRRKDGVIRRGQVVSRKEHKVTTVTEHRVSETRVSTDYENDNSIDHMDENNQQISEPCIDQGDSMEMIDEDLLEEIEEYIDSASEMDDEHQARNEDVGDAEKFTDVKRFKCSSCRKAFGTKLELIFHQSHYHVSNLRDDQNEIKCPLCDKILDSTAVRLNHVNSVHRNRDTNMIHCPQCPKLFKHMSTIMDHMVAHQEQVHHVCDICGKGFRRLGNLQGHYATHNEDTSYACHLCTKTFKTHQLRRKHIRYVHSAVKRLQCEQCEKRFSDHSDLRRHRWVHGGYEKKFECNLCDMRFFEQKRLRVHQKTHIKPKKKRGKSDAPLIV